MDCSPPRIPEWVAISSSREFSWLSDRTHISYGSCIGRWVLMPPGKPVYIHAHINRIFIIGMDSRDYGGQGSPMVYCAVWKLEMQGNQGCDSFWVQRVENQRNVSILSLVKLDFPALAEKLFPHSAFFFSVQTFKGLDDVHPPWWGQSFLLSLLIQILNSYGDTLTDTLWNNVIYQLPGHPLAQSSWHIKVAVTVFSRASQVVLVVKNQSASAVDIKDLGLIPGLRRSSRRRAWQPIQVFLPGESRGQRIVAGCSPWGHKSQTQLKRLRTAQQSTALQGFLLIHCSQL